MAGAIRSILARIDYLAVLLVLLAAMAGPILARIIGDMLGEAWGLALPGVVLVALVCIIRPIRFMPPLLLSAMYLAEWAAVAAGQRNIAPSIVREFQAGRLVWLIVPAVALVGGYAIVWARLRRGPLRLPFKSNLSLLANRPADFVYLYRYAIAIMLLGATLDTITTMSSMYSYGTAGELHPGMKMLSEEFGITLGVPVGTAVRLLFVTFVAAIFRRWCGWIMMICGLLYCLAAASNHFLWL